MSKQRKPGDHVWTAFISGQKFGKTHIVCKLCGVPKRADGRNTLCLGAQHKQPGKVSHARPQGVLSRAKA